MTRDEIISLLADAACRGSLGLFVGSGFSMAATGNQAPNWKDLLKQVADNLALPDPFEDTEAIVGLSLPQVASGICAQLEAQLDEDGLAAPWEEAVSRVKEAVSLVIREADIDQGQRDAFREAFEQIDPAWFVTTNYDILIQQVHDNTRTLYPNSLVGWERNRTPVWHIHGVVLDPATIILTDEDYVHVLAPASYRQTKLGHLLIESTTLMIGYRLTDTNIRVAASLRNRLRKIDVDGPLRRHDGSIVVADYDMSAAEPPYVDPLGVVHIGIDDLAGFLNEVGSHVQRLRREEEQAAAALEPFLADADSLVDDVGTRCEFVNLVKNYPHVYRDELLLQTLDAIFAELTRRSQQSGAFSYYDSRLELALEFALAWDWSEMPPTVAQLLCEQIARVAGMIEPDGRHRNGWAHDATDRWAANKEQVFNNPHLSRALEAYARIGRNVGLQVLLAAEE